MLTKKIAAIIALIILSAFFVSFSEEDLHENHKQQESIQPSSEKAETELSITVTNRQTTESNIPADSMPVRQAVSAVLDGTGLYSIKKDDPAVDSSDKPYDIQSSASSEDQSQTQENLSSDAPASDQNDSSSENPSQNQNQPAEEETTSYSDHAAQTEEETSSEVPVSYNGLHVSGTRLVNENGEPVQLRGISTHGLAWYPQYVNQQLFYELHNNFGMNVIRLSMYTAESGGYCTGGDQNALKQLIDQGVTYASNAGMYVIIDWHILSDGNPNTYKAQAIQFFTEMAQKYAGYSNVIYEICNEPNGGTSWNEIRSYAIDVTNAIRQYDDAPIIVGTPNWSQYVNEAAANPLPDGNTLYALHFYAGTHKENLRNTMISALNSGLPVFVSEFGVCDASGNGNVDTAEADRWISVLNQYGVSYCCWSLSNKAESASFILSSCTKTSGLTLEDLSESGKWLVKTLTGITTAAQQTIGQSEDQTSAQQTDQGTGQPADQSSDWIPETSPEPESSAEEGQPMTDSAHETIPEQQPEESSEQITEPETEQSTQSAESDTEPSQAVQTEPEETISAVCLTDSELSETITKVNEWDSDEFHFEQYSCTLQNVSGINGNSWEIHINIENLVSLESGWNGIYSVSGSTLTITSMDYNGSLVSGAQTGDIGFIVKKMK